MKVGDLVRRRFITGAERRRAKRTMGISTNEIGVVTQLTWQGESGDNCWVMWGSSAKLKLMPARRLEIVNEGR